MGQNHSSTGPDQGEFDKTRWSMVWKPCRAERLVSRKLWLSYAGAIGGRSTPLPGGVVARPRTPKTWSRGFLNT
jgi:hypothetical protein